MKILVGKTFGIGNFVLSIPMIKALSTLGSVDILVGSMPDDGGAVDLAIELTPKYVNTVFVDRALIDAYDVAIMAIPFDGRWQNGVNFNATTVLDCRKRPDNVQELGFHMWKKHEVEYQMENARVLGFSGETPSLNFFPRIPINKDMVYVGIGYKRDPGGFGLSKHFGTNRYALLMSEISRLRPETKFISTGTMVDFVQVGSVLARLCPSYSFTINKMIESIKMISGSAAYIGNDTGMMHIAASMDIPTMALMSAEYPDLAIKNPPLCSKSAVEFFDDEINVKSVAEKFINFVWG